MKSYFRKNIDDMSGYAPGEQPKIENLIKLNTNENAYPPSPKVVEALKGFEANKLRRYPMPNSDVLIGKIAEVISFDPKNIIVGNGSDDILTMIFRAFTDESKPLGCFEPSYSLYPTLAKMQNAPVIEVKLDREDFSMPENTLEQIKGANLLIIARPNAPTGNLFPLENIRKICANFDGIVLIDEAYADFSSDNCLMLAKEFENVIVSRTFSKSYSLAGLRVGYAVASQSIIEGLFKLKDSYNSDMIAQELALNAISDQKYFNECCSAIKQTRDMLIKELKKLDFKVINSEANFVFASPADGDGEKYFKYLRDNAILVRYFPAESTRKYVRITVGTDSEIKTLLDITKKYKNL